MLQLSSTASGGRTAPPFQIELHPANQAPNATSPASPDSSGGVPKPSTHAPEQTPRRPSSPTFSVVIDPAHGGSDSGARIAPHVLEKDLTLLLARKLRQELQARHIAASLLRDNDSNLTFDQRAVAVNLARPAIFVTLHAEPGSVIRIYTAASNLIRPPERDRTGFLPFENAQGAFQNESGVLASTAAAAVEKRELTALILPSFVEPLHSIAAPAIAVEAPASKKGFKISADLLAGALADAIAIRKMSSGAAQ